MSTKRTIKAKEIVFDIRSGMTEEQLIDKYDVSLDKLKNIFKRLLNTDCIEGTELKPLTSILPGKLNVSDRRHLKRSYVFLILPICDIQNLPEEGVIVDISEIGLQIIGIPARVGEKKEVLIQVDYFGDVYPFVIEAQCQWASKSESGQLFSGFKITSISEEGLKELQKVTRMLTISG